MTSDVTFRNNRDVNNSNCGKETALRLAAMAGNEDDVRRLLKSGADVMSSDRDGCTALHSAAQSAQPSCDVTRLLLDALRKTGRQIGDCPKDSAGNTPLHIAAGNVNVSAEFIGIVFDLRQHCRPNNELDTPFHVAAKSDNPATIIALLRSLTASRRGRSIDELDSCRLPEDLTLMELSAVAGNAEAVAVMIQNGADITHRLLHVVITESVRDPSKIDRLTRVYHAIVDNALHWRSVHEHEKFPVGHKLYFQRRMQTVMYLLTRRGDEKATGERKRNVLEHAIAVGAHEMLETIVNTENVFRFSDNPFYRSSPTSDTDLRYGGMWYIITNFVSSTESPSLVNQLAQNNGDIENARDRPTVATQNVMHDFDKVFKPKRPYLTSMVLDNSSQWRKTNILLSEPFQELTNPFINFVQLVYFLLAFIQFLYMILFASFCLPTACSLSARFHIMLPRCNNSSSDRGEEQLIGLQVEEFPRCLWLLWPCVMFISSSWYLAVTYAHSIIDTISTFRSKVVGYTANSRNLKDTSQTTATPTSPSSSDGEADDSGTNRDDAYTVGPSSPSTSSTSEGEDETDGNYVSERPNNVYVAKNTPAIYTANVSHGTAASATGRAASERRSTSRHEYISVFILTINHFPVVAFCVAVFLWYVQSGSSVTMHSYVQTTSMIFLFGWTTGFVFFSGIKREFYLFSLVLREFIAKDICYKFIPLFFFTVIAFSFSIYLLELPNGQSQTSVGRSLYDMIMVAAAFEQTTDSESSDGRPWLPRLVFTIYVYLTAVVLLNVLIAMMNHRYDDAKIRAKREWRFRSVEIAMTIQDNKLYQWITRPFCRLPLCQFLRCVKHYVNDSQQFLIPIVRTKQRTSGVYAASRSTVHC